MSPEPASIDSLPSQFPDPISSPAASPPPHDPLDKSTFIPPSFNAAISSPNEELPRIVIEFCDRCRWLSRATWTLTELFLTFPPISIDVEVDDPIAAGGGNGEREGNKGKVERKESGLKAISLLPRSAPETGGRFRVWLYRAKTENSAQGGEVFESWDGAELVWDRKLEGGFPEMKELKQRIRNLISPLKDLGHSDKDAFGNKPVKEVDDSTLTKEDAVVEGLGALKLDEGVVANAEEKEKEEERETVVDDYAPRFRC